MLAKPPEQSLGSVKEEASECRVCCCARRCAYRGGMRLDKLLLLGASSRGQYFMIPIVQSITIH